jgi:hypothetical protein
LFGSVVAHEYTIVHEDTELDVVFTEPLLVPVSEKRKSNSLEAAPWVFKEAGSTHQS